MFARLCALALCAGLAAPASAQVLADSVADFSGTQGDRGWHYGSYSGAMNPGSFTPMIDYDGRRWRVQQPDFWTMLGPRGAHPNGGVTTGAPARLAEQWAVRRWVSSYEGQVVIDVELCMMTHSLLSNGIVGRIFVDGQEIWSQYIGGGDMTGVRPQILTNVNTGSTIDFALDTNSGHDWADSTVFTGIITAVPGPGSLALLVFGGLVSLRRRR